MSVVVPSPIKALRFYLLGESRVTNLVEQRVYGEEIPYEDAHLMPRPTLVLAHGGYGSTSGSDAQTSTILTTRIEARAYGRTRAEIDALDKAMYLSMHVMRRMVVGNALLYANVHTDGPRPGIDAETDWRYLSRSYLLRMDKRPAI